MSSLLWDIWFDLKKWSLEPNLAKIGFIQPKMIMGGLRCMYTKGVKYVYVRSTYMNYTLK